jgi:hypothetical protein
MEGLDAPFSKDEIWAAISAMLSEKAPGMDGFTSAFYKLCWTIIKTEVVNAFLHLQYAVWTSTQVEQCNNFPTANKGAS